MQFTEPPKDLNAVSSEELEQLKETWWAEGRDIYNDVLHVCSRSSVRRGPIVKGDLELDYCLSGNMIVTWRGNKVLDDKINLFVPGEWIEKFNQFKERRDTLLRIEKKKKLIRQLGLE